MLRVTPLPAATPGGTRRGRLRHPQRRRSQQGRGPSLSLGPSIPHQAVLGISLLMALMIGVRVRLPVVPVALASRAPSPQAARHSSGSFSQRLGLLCLAPARKWNANSVSGCLGCAGARRLRAAQSGRFGRRGAAGAAGGSGDAPLPLPRGDARELRRSRSPCASHPAAVSPGSCHAELSPR